MQNQFKTWLNAPTDGRVLGIFRILFGLLMTYEVLNYFKIDLVKNAFILPRARLGYDFLQFVQPLPEGVMQGMLGLMLVCAVLITAGWLFRTACWAFGGLYLYLFLLDKSIFNNHIYLFILFAILLGFTHADRFFSLRNVFSKVKNAVFEVPRWEHFILQLQLAIVYFYGGIAKLNPDWLGRMEPMKSMVAQMPAGIFKMEFMTPLLTYGGLLFDLAVPFLLWWKPTRKWTLLPLVFFHLSNSQIFDDIGIFPFTMILATILFFEAGELPFLKNAAVKTDKKAKKTLQLLASTNGLKLTLAGFFIFQLLFPFRGFFLPNNMDWTSIGNRFSWRMKIQTRVQEELAYTIQDGTGGQPAPVQVDQFINPMQILSVIHDPRAAADFAKMLAEEGKHQGMNDPVVKARIKVRWNGRPAGYTVDPEVDLSKVTYSPFAKMDWMVPKPE